MQVCESGDLAAVQRLCQPEFKAIANIHAINEDGFRSACKLGHLDLVKFLTTSKELLDAGHTFVDIHPENEDGFQWACEYSQWNIIQFLIFDLNMKKTPEIEAIPKDCPQDYIKKSSSLRI